MLGEEIEPDDVEALHRLPWVPRTIRPDESLLGYVADCVHDAGLEGLFQILSRAGQEFAHRPGAHVGGALDVDALAIAMRTSRAGLARAAHAPDGEHDVDFFGAIIPKWQVATRVRRFSTAFLEDEGYHRGSWEHLMIPFCSKSWEFLGRRCPDCLAFQRWIHTAGLSNCDRGHPLEARRRLVPAEWRNVLSFAAGLVSSDALETAASMERLPAPLKELSRTDCWRLLTALFPIVGARRALRNDLRWWSSRPFRLAWTLREAAEVILGWPSSLVHVIERTAGRRIGNRDDERHRTMGAFLRGETLRDGARKAVLDVARSLRAVEGGRFAGTLDAVSVRTAAFALGTGTGEIAEARRAGLLRTRIMINGGEIVPGLDRREIETLRGALRNRSSVFATSRRIGIPAYAVEDLVTLGVLAHDPHPYLAVRKPWPFLSATDVEAVVRRLSTSGAEFRAPSAGTLRQLFRTMAPGPRPWARMLQAHLNGTASLVCDPGAGPVGRRLLATADQVAEFAAAHCDIDADGTPAADRVVSTEDAVEMLGLTVKDSRRVRRTLLASSPDGLIRMSSVKTFQDAKDREKHASRK